MGTEAVMPRATVSVALPVGLPSLNMSSTVLLVGLPESTQLVATKNVELPQDGEGRKSQVPPWRMQEPKTSPGWVRSE